nr:pappalysin-2-like [Symphalangus syndactylus]
MQGFYSHASPLLSVVLPAFSSWGMSVQQRASECSAEDEDALVNCGARHEQSEPDVAGRPGASAVSKPGSASCLQGLPKLLKIQCLEGGIWEQGSCIPVVCEPPPPVFEGMYECTNGFNLDSQCVLNCNQEREKLPILCTKEGLWTQEFKLCENLQGECPPPPSELNSVEYKCEQGYGIGAVCSPLCVIPPSDPVMLPENITADTLEHWMEPVKVQSIVCTGRRQWHPDPVLVHCIQSCEPFQADGWCDTINNRAYCHYDGGDCCSSTLSSKKVSERTWGWGRQWLQE